MKPRPWIVLLACLACCARSVGQRVQVPEYNGAYGAAPVATTPPPAGGAAPMYGPPLGAPAFDPYAAPLTSAPYAYPPPAAPAYSAPYQSPAPPYGATPYGAAPPYPATVATPTTASPFAWDSGTYGFQTADGVTVEFQKFLQAIRAEYTYIYGDHGANALDINRLELSSTVAFPMGGNIQTPLLVTPGFAFNWLEGPVTVPTMTSSGADLPPRVYDAYLDLAWRPQCTPVFGADLGVRTGVWTDFDEVNSDSVRLLGRGLGKLRVSPTLEILAGVVYLDRVDVKLAPAGGFHLRPNDVWDIFMVFPIPKVSRRLAPYGGVDWVWFAAGEYGGGSWTVDRLIGSDRFDYNDIRITTGFEWENERQVGGHIEVGVAFERELVYASGDPGHYPLDTTLMLRGGFDF